jgi:hypothetical protein
VKDDLAFEVRHLVTEFPLLQNAQTLPSRGNGGSLSKVRRQGLEAEHKPPFSDYVKDVFSYVSTPIYDIILWTRTALPYCLLTYGCSSLSYVRRHYKRFPPDSDQAEGQTCRRCADNGAVYWPFSSFSISLTLSTLQYRRDSAADCCYLLTTVVAAVTSDLWSSNIKLFLNNRRCNIQNKRNFTPHSITLPSFKLLSRFYFINIWASYQYTGCTFCGLPEHGSISAKQARAGQEFRALGDTSMK